MPRDTIPPTKEKVKGPGGGDETKETHPAFGQVSVGRYSNTDTTLFDSDVRHRQTIHLTISTATRRRGLNHDWIMDDKRIIDVEMSMAQWAAVVSSPGSSGVPCTIRFREAEGVVPDVPFEPRVEESVNEVREAGRKALAHVWEAFKVAEERPNKGNLKKLRWALEGVPNNLGFAADSLTEHVERVVTNARADLEAIVLAEAERIGLEPGDVANVIPELGGGDG